MLRLKKIGRARGPRYEGMIMQVAVAGFRVGKRSAPTVLMAGAVAGARCLPAQHRIKRRSGGFCSGLKKSAAPFRRRPGRTGRTRCEGMTIQGRIVLPDPWPEGKRRGIPAGAIFCREPGLQRGRRRTPFVRSREEDAHINAALWRTERCHRRCIVPINPEVGAHSLTRPTTRSAAGRWMRSAYLPQNLSSHLP